MAKGKGKAGITAGAFYTELQAEVGATIRIGIGMWWWCAQPIAAVGGQSV